MIHLLRIPRGPFQKGLFGDIVSADDFMALEFARLLYKEAQ